MRGLLITVLYGYQFLMFNKNLQYQPDSVEEIERWQHCTLISDTAMAPGLTFPSSCLQTPRTNWWGRTKIKMSAFSAASFTSGMATWNHKNSFNFSQSCMNQCSFKEWLKWPKNISLCVHVFDYHISF